MRSKLLEETQGIYGFNVDGCHAVKEDDRKVMEVFIRRKTFSCPKCGSGRVSVYKGQPRRIRGLPYGRLEVVFIVEVHDIYCLDCHEKHYEHFEFLRTPESRVTRQMERTINDLRQHMSIKALATYFDLPWETVKNIEKAMLGHKYARVRLSDVRHIGIDEIYLFHKEKKENKYVTVVRNLDTGEVLEVARGKGVKALKSFERRIRKHKNKIKSVCMDMSNSYSAWVRQYLPKAEIIFDHFHIIQAMNEYLTDVRRRVVRDLDENTRKELKGLSRLFLKNREDLSEDVITRFDNARKLFQPLSEAYLLKEQLRSIYANARDEHEARIMFADWINMARNANIPELRCMAKLIDRHLDGILAYWRFNGLTNAKSEGFNNKIRWLVSQAYGFRDYEYLRLKIFHLPSTETRRAI